MRCPCCGNPGAETLGAPAPHSRCLGCGHVWRPESFTPTHYSSLRGRNVVDAAHGAKLRDRLKDVTPLLRAGANVLEVGCAEGSLGAAAKLVAPVRYAGVELSEDAELAGAVLDRVFRTSTSGLSGEVFDLVLSFHVLEHIQEPAVELGHWRRLIADAGTLVVEVPNFAGHKLLDWDPNVEHVHQFSPASLCAVLQRAGFRVERLSTGHFESATYPDSVRVVAVPALTGAARRALLVDRFLTRMRRPCLAWGIGGDFRGYVEPLLHELPIVALVDSSEARQGERHDRLAVERYDPDQHGHLDILVCSIRYRASIAADLAARGIAADRIIGLDEILGGAPPHP